MKEKFKQIFEGLKIAYGQYQKGERGENGKQGGKAFIVRGNVTDDLWDNHLKGEGPALGIIPITENNTCRWGCIDIDEYNFNHLVLITNIRKLKLPLIVCRSKSGGAHVFLFTKKFVSAFLMGLVFCYERKFTHSNIPGIITHGILNWWIGFGSLSIVFSWILSII